MIKIVSLLAGLTGAAAGALAAAAPVDASVTYNAAGVSVLHAVPLPRAAGPAAAPRTTGGTVIYSNFNSDPTNLYDCCNGYTVRGQATGLGYQRMAMPFTPASDTHLRQVNIAMGYVGGTNRITGTLQADDNGLPGAVISTITLQGFQALGNCCATRAVTGDDIPLQGGKTYWIVATPMALGALAWNDTNTGAVGPGAFDAGSGWESFFDMQSAFEVIGD